MKNDIDKIIMYRELIKSSKDPVEKDYLEYLYQRNYERVLKKLKDEVIDKDNRRAV